MLTATVEYRLEDGVAIITVQNPPVNALSHSVRIGLMEALSRADADPAAKALVLLGGGRTYMAGADLKEFGRPKDPPELHDVQNAMETLGKPLVSAIHGTALGGGLEVALTGHWRVAARDAKLGLPEIKLGLMPGAGGNQRLTRLIGPVAALDLILSGRPISAEQALESGIIDAIVDGNLLAGALDFARKIIREGRSLRVVRHLKDKTTNVDPTIFSNARAEIARTLPGLLAPQKIVDCIEAACTLPTDDSFRFDAESYKQCLDSPQRKAMIHLFFAERSCRKIPGLSEGPSANRIRQAAIIGAGSVGAGIALKLAEAGIRVKLIDASSEAVAKALNILNKSPAGKSVEGYSNHDAATGAELVIECLFENLTLKREALSHIEHVVSDECILATDTSFLDIDDIAAALTVPERLLGAHFYNPADSGQLIELIRGSRTSPQAIATLFELGRTIDQTVVLSGRSSGAIGRRMLQFLIAGAEHLLLLGCPLEQLDGALERFGFPCGPLALCDVAGLDVVRHMRQMRAETGILRPHHNRLLDALVQHGLTGRRSGAGYYLYGNGVRHPNPAALSCIAALASVPKHAWNDADIVARLLHPVVCEGARLLEEGTALRASDIDLVWVRGLGFPQYLGGPMYWASQVGLKPILAQSRALATEFGPDWQAPDLMGKLVASNTSFISE
jgi:3-hydroxyacyl-CoA dehydrogenase